MAGEIFCIPSFFIFCCFCLWRLHALGWPLDNLFSSFIKFSTAFTYKKTTIFLEDNFHPNPQINSFYFP